MIIGIVSGQKLKLSTPVIAADSVGFLSAEFTFTAEWDKYAHKYAHFRLDDEHEGIFELNGGKITEDMHLDLSRGSWQVWVHGNYTDDAEDVHRATSTIAVLDVVRTGAIDGEPFPGMEATVVEKLVEQANGAAETATSAKAQAQSSATAALSYKNTAGQYKDAAKVYRDEASDAATKAGRAADQAEAAKLNTYTKAEIDRKIDEAKPEGYNELKEQVNENTDVLAELNREMAGAAEIVGQHSAEIAHQAQLMPSGAPTVGKTLKVLSVNPDGTFTCEWADAASGGVEDVQIGGKSILSDGVANIPFGKNDSVTKGVICTNGANSGLYITDGFLSTASLTVAEYASRGNYYLITKGTLENVLSDRLDKEWVLKGTITEPSGVANLDLSGCTELIIFGTGEATGNASLRSDVGMLIYNALTTSRKVFYSFLADSLLGFDTIICKYGANTTTIADNGTGYCYFNDRKISSLRDISIRESEIPNVTSINMKIYAR